MPSSLPIRSPVALSVTRPVPNVELVTDAVVRPGVFSEIGAAVPAADSGGERTVLAALAHVVLLYAIKRGLDPDDLCASGGFHASDLADRDRQVPYTWLLALTRALEKRVPDARLQTEIARDAAIEQFGYFGQALKHAATPLETLRALTRYARLLDSTMLLQRIELSLDADTVQLVLPNGCLQSRAWVETVIAGCVGMLRAVGPGELAPREIRLPRTAAKLDARVLEYVAAVVNYESSDARIVFDRALLERPARCAEDNAARYFGAQVDKLVEQLDQPFVVLVSRAIAAQLTRGDLSQRRIGRHLALSPRSLQRKLHQHGLKYTTLVEDTRKAVAARLLLDPARSISDVAAELGYRDASSFTRVFKRWTGVNPRRYRDRQRALSVVS